MIYKVVFSPEAENDLLELYLYIAERTGDAHALVYIERLERYCKGFEEFPERGTSRDDLFPGLRVVGFERRVSIAFHVNQVPLAVNPGGKCKAAFAIGFGWDVGPGLVLIGLFPDGVAIVVFVGQQGDALACYAILMVVGDIRFLVTDQRAASIDDLLGMSRSKTNVSLYFIEF